MRSFLFKRHLIMTTLIFFALAINAQEFDSRLKPLEPLLKSKWEGFLKSPDGSEKFRVIRTFEILQKGRIIKCTKTNVDRGNYGEGFFFWDDQHKKIAFFFVEDNGVFNKGFVETDSNLIKIKGTMTWPRKPNPQVRQTFNFRNTFDINEDGTLTDSWFQDAFGGWRPGHVISFHPDGYPTVSSKEKIIPFSDKYWDLKGAKVGKHLGREALMGTSFLKDAEFAEGTISVDIATAERGGAAHHLILPRDDDLFSADHGALEGFKRDGERLGIPLRYKCRVRNPWWRVPGLVRAELLLPYMIGAEPHVAVNRCYALYPNSLHGLRLRNPALADRIALGLLTSLSLLSMELEGRSYGGGVLKLEPTEMQRVRLVLPTAGEAELHESFDDADRLMRQGDFCAAVAVADELVLSRQLHMAPTDIERIQVGRAALVQRRLTRSRR